MLEIKKTIKEKSWIIMLFAIFIFSFILDMYILTRYNLSYGRDGPFYDLQVLSIIQTGFPASNDPPLVYYMLTPFVMLTENSFLGIKIGMALIGSLMAFPAYFLTEMFSKKMKSESRVPALLAAFLITVNPFYFGMIGDFMQNLVGVFFLLLLMYFAVKWFENTKNWKKYGILTIILLVCSIFTHIYTGILAVVLFVSLLLFNFGFKTYKTGKIHLFDLKILGLLGVLIIGGLAVLFVIYPVMFSKFTTVLSFLNNSSTSGSDLGRGGTGNPLIFFTLPFLLGIFAILTILYRGLKSKNNIQVSVISKKTLLSWLYIVMTVVLVILSILPSIDSQYRGRFIMLAFVPIALLVPLGLKYIETWLSKKNASKGLKLGLIALIAIIFAMSSLYGATEEFSSMGPSISTEQYNSLLELKNSYLDGEIDSDGIIVVSDYHTGYWAEYVLGMHVETGTADEVAQKYSDKTIYTLTLTESQQSGLKGGVEYSWNPLLPYSFPFGGISIQDSSNGHPSSMSSPPDIQKNNMTAPPSRSGNNTQFAMSPPGQISGNETQDMGSINNQGSDQQTYSDGTLIFGANGLKIYKIS
ncbi:glycosyltransferase family 39 protein [Methanobacterium oryzae]|uniref:glycosyltransferase family 39 protein n=1 Tax=Methanobacterium oryzae TaxID=69540 RepID=UPI003D2106AB